jgi:hypothetical protein
MGKHPSAAAKQQLVVAVAAGPNFILFLTPLLAAATDSDLLVNMHAHRIYIYRYIYIPQAFLSLPDKRSKKRFREIDENCGCGR